jgi:hypothetical protein
MTIIHLCVAGILLLQSATATKPPAQKPAAAARAAAASGDLRVTLTYRGKGVVDEKHKLIAWMFTDPNVTSASRPIGTETATKNGAALTFKNAPATPVYVFAVYDQTGSYDGVSGPPPAGLPYALYKKTAKGAPTAVSAGGAPIAFTFTDAERWNK